MISSDEYARMLAVRTQHIKNETKEAIEIILSELNKGQRKKISANETVQIILKRYDIDASKL